MTYATTAFKIIGPILFFGSFLLGLAGPVLVLTLSVIVVMAGSRWGKEELAEEIANGEANLEEYLDEDADIDIEGYQQASGNANQ